MKRPEFEPVEWVMRTSEGQRYVHLRTDVLNELRRDLSNIFSSKVAGQIFYRIGLATGRTAWQRIKQAIRSEEQFWQVIDEITRLRGWGHILSHEKSLHNDNLTITVIYGDSAFADGVTAREPVCDIVRGAVASALASFYGRTIANANESYCMATGAPNCVFIIELKSTSTKTS